VYKIFKLAYEIFMRFMHEWEPIRKFEIYKNEKEQLNIIY